MAASISDIRLLLRVKVLPRAIETRRIFVTGATGHLGNNLVPVLVERGHRVRALVRAGSKGQVPAGCEVVSGNALDANTYRQLIRPCDTFLHLLGNRPSSSKAAEFRSVDLVAGREAIEATAELSVPHFIYLSVAPVPFMKTYNAVRAECEGMIQKKHLNATILRPGCILGPERRWTHALQSLVKLAEWMPVTRLAAQRLGVVTLQQIVLALVEAVESTVQGTRVMSVPEIRAAQLSAYHDKARQTA